MKCSIDLRLNFKVFGMKEEMRAKLIKTEVNFILEDEGGVVIASTSLEKEGLALSLRNCQAIERDNPAEEYILEVNGDGWDDHLYIGRRKQTEWYVELEMDFIGRGKHGVGSEVNHYLPKKDSDGCLILRAL
jgi:hypothetical protein